MMVTGHRRFEERTGTFGTPASVHFEPAVGSQNLLEIRSPVVTLRLASGAAHRDQHAQRSDLRDTLQARHVAGARDWRADARRPWREHRAGICRGNPLGMVRAALARPWPRCEKPAFAPPDLGCIPQLMFEIRSLPVDPAAMDGSPGRADAGRPERDCGFEERRCSAHPRSEKPCSIALKGRSIEPNREGNARAAAKSDNSNQGGGKSMILPCSSSDSLRLAWAICSCVCPVPAFETIPKAAMPSVQARAFQPISHRAPSRISRSSVRRLPQVGLRQVTVTSGAANRRSKRTRAARARMRG